MSLGPVLDVAIGLVFVYLILGLITTAFQELLANALKLRGKMLHNALTDLLAENDGHSALVQKFLGHALIGGIAANDHPSYIPSKNFALALIDILSDGSGAPIFTQVEHALENVPDGPAKDALRVFVRHAGGDLDALKASLAGWYDDAMDRLSGVYKRNAQWIALACGVFFAIALNIDSLRIAENLALNDALRNKVETAAAAYQQPQGTPDQQLNANLNTLNALNLPIGWPQVAEPPSRAAGVNERPNIFVQAAHGFFGYFGKLGWGGTILVILGWAMTALATSLGAPFWFDMLQRLLNLRSSGPKPAKQSASRDPS